jgi:hypothetical protein
MYTYFTEGEMLKHNTPPKWDVPLITQKDPNKIPSR